MNSDLIFAFHHLRFSERRSVLSELGYSTTQGMSETNSDFQKRVLTQIAHDGKLRELENEMRRFQ